MSVFGYGQAYNFLNPQQAGMQGSMPYDVPQAQNMSAYNSMPNPYSSMLQNVNMQGSQLNPNMNQVNFNPESNGDFSNLQGKTINDINNPLQQFMDSIYKNGGQFQGKAGLAPGAASGIDFGAITRAFQNSSQNLSNAYADPNFNTSYGNGKSNPLSNYQNRLQVQYNEIKKNYQDSGALGMQGSYRGMYGG